MLRTRIIQLCKKGCLAAFLLVVCLAPLAGCAQARTLSPEEYTQAESASEALVLNMLDGMERGDFSVFSRDFQGDLKVALKESDFNDLRATIRDRLGLLQDHQLVSLEEINGYINATYQLTYQRGQAVSLRVVLGNDTPRGIIMLAFDSPELNQP